MTTVRCPSCDASVPADAAWCTLCFAQLGVQTPAPASLEPATPETAALLPEPLAPMPEPAAPASPLSPFAAFPPVLPVSAPVLSAPVPAQPTQAPEPASSPAASSVATAVIDPAAAPTWPCTSCDARVALEEMTCPACGTPFMGGVSPSVSLKVPGVGDLATMSSGMKFMVIAGGATVFSLLMVLVFLVLGHIF